MELGTVTDGGEDPNENSNVVMPEDTSNLVEMEMSSTDSHIEQVQSNIDAPKLELDDQLQYIHVEEHYIQSHTHRSFEKSTSVKPQLTTQNILSPPIKMCDSAENLSKMPEPISESKFLHRFKIPKKKNNNVTVDWNHLQEANQADIKKNAR